MKESYVLKYKEKYDGYVICLASFDDQELAREMCLVLNKCVASLSYKFNVGCVPACCDGNIDAGLFVFENITSSELKKDIVKNMYIYNIVMNKFVEESRGIHESYMCSLLSAISPFSIITINHFEKV